MFTLVIVREPRKRTVFTVRDDATGREVFRAFKREVAVEAQAMLGAFRKEEEETAAAA